MLPQFKSERWAKLKCQAFYLLTGQFIVENSGHVPLTVEGEGGFQVS